MLKIPVEHISCEVPRTTNLRISRKMIARVVLYGFVSSPPFRGSALACEALGVKWEMKEINVKALEHHSPEYLKLNPLHSIPTMIDGDYVLFDSHAISAYLANKYGKDDRWYPKEPKLRGIVDQRLHYDGSVAGPAFKNYAVPLLFGKKPHPNTVTLVKEGMDGLEKLLGDKQFIAHNWPTIADCHCASTVFSVKIMLPETIPPRLAAWLARCEDALPGYKKVQDAATLETRALTAFASKL